MRRSKIALSSGKTVMIPPPASFAMEASGYSDEAEYCRIQAKEFFIYYQKKNGRVTLERPLKKIIFENMLDAAFKIDFLWEYVLTGKGSFEDYFRTTFVQKVNSLDDDKFIKYYMQLERNIFRSNPSGVAFFCPEAVQHCFNIYVEDPMQAFFGLSFNLFYFQYLGLMFKQLPPIIPARSLNRNEVYELNTILVNLASPLIQRSFGIFEKELLPHL